MIRSPEASLNSCEVRNPRRSINHGTKGVFDEERLGGGRGTVDFVGEGGEGDDGALHDGHVLVVKDLSIIPQQFQQAMTDGGEWRCRPQKRQDQQQ